MVTASEQLDKRFQQFEPVVGAARPARGWIKAVREALGMTTAQLARRLGVKQPRIVEMEKAEAHGNITLQSLERAAEALGCRLVYVLVPIKPLTQTLEERASRLAEQQLAAVEQSMKLEAQGVSDKKQRKQAHQRRIEELLQRPARLWDE
jgi:predicted DNA-binding mobile mystery protein A